MGGKEIRFYDWRLDKTLGIPFYSVSLIKTQSLQIQRRPHGWFRMNKLHRAIDWRANLLLSFFYFLVIFLFFYFFLNTQTFFGEQLRLTPKFVCAKKKKKRRQKIKLGGKTSVCSLHFFSHGVIPSIFPTSVQLLYRLRICSSDSHTTNPKSSTVW